jgi:hypothetical protein
MKTKTFDCVTMKRQAQEQIYLQIGHLSLVEKMEFYNAIGATTKAKLSQSTTNTPPVKTGIS